MAPPTERYTLAARFVNSTGTHIFLTGKAGTGKTTFLHNLGRATHKNYIVVAPTGIAALNAGGVTIHSQFLLPLGTFIPDRSPTGHYIEDGAFYTQHTLARKNPLNSPRKQVLRDIELLIIDEVSMLRADILDAIDYRLRSVRGNYHQSFGGVQVLLIGDLYQLPPIVKDHEWRVMQQYYRSPHFFHAHALQQDGFVYIELDHIFRQQDPVFIRILNNLRNNVITEADISVLNEHYRQGGEADVSEEGTITIVTHNAQADRLNQRMLQQLPGTSAFFRAHISGDFPESMYPLPEILELKVGAQIMFIKNDTEQRMYYNGKLARVVEIDEEDGIRVELADGDGHLWLHKESWENKKYIVDAATKELTEDVVGSFEQYPVKLAWAITVHKSQGLTFDRAIIDVGRAFAPGQVYVALSRLRSLDGLMLRTRIDYRTIASDEEVVHFSQREAEQDALQEMLMKQQQRYLFRLLMETFDFSHISKQLSFVQKDKSGDMEFEDPEMQNALDVMQSRIQGERDNTEKFRQQLTTLLDRSQQELLLERISKGSTYYTTFLKEQMKHLLKHIEQVKRLTRTKTYLNALNEIDQLLARQLNDLEKAAYVAGCILQGREIEPNAVKEKSTASGRMEILKEVREMVGASSVVATRKSGRVRKPRKTSQGGEAKARPPAGYTYQETYALLREGKGIEEIARLRSMAASTIEGHLARGIASGEVDIQQVVPIGEVLELVEAIAPHKEASLGELRGLLDNQISFGKLRMVKAYMDKGGGGEKS
jgi:hypothetical protein